MCMYVHATLCMPKIVICHTYMHTHGLADHLYVTVLEICESISRVVRRGNSIPEAAGLASPPPPPPPSSCSANSCSTLTTWLMVATVGVGGGGGGRHSGGSQYCSLWSARERDSDGC